MERENKVTVASPVSSPQCNRYKSEDKESHKQAAADSGSSKVLQSVSVHETQQLVMSN